MSAFTGTSPDPTSTTMDAALSRLRERRSRWRGLSLQEKILLLDDARARLAAVAPEWAERSADAKGLDRGSPAAGEEWMAVAFLLEGMAMLRRSLHDLARGRPPRIPGVVRSVGMGQLEVPVFPQRYYHRLFHPGTTSAIWTEPGLTEEEVRAGQLSRLEDPGPARVVLVLGAGNVSILGPSDLLDKLFCDGDVVVYKPNPVIDYLTPLVEEVFRALIRGRYLEVVRGGGEAGAYLASHPLVDAVHLTASHATFETIVFGPGPDGAVRKRAGVRLNRKPITAELGNVSPVIVVPGPWSPSDLASQAEHLAGMQVVNAGLNCLTTRVIIQSADWEHRATLLDGVRAVLARTPTRPAFYPGSEAVHGEFVAAHPEAERFGAPGDGHLPWTLIADVDSARSDDVCFTREPFCPLFSETALKALDPPDFLDRAVRFANEVLWGSLTATILVHPASLRDRRMARALERAVAELRYGTVGVNVWGALAYGTMAGSWGAFPGHPDTDIQSGRGTIHNYLMIPNPRKTVIRGPFRQRPRPLNAPGHRTFLPLARRVVAFQAEHSPLRLPGVVGAAVRA